MSNTAASVFVFGSNLAGRHGRGAAAYAARWCGAELGVGEGPTGNAYAIPTKDVLLHTRPLIDVRAAIARFIAYAYARPDCTFEVTRIGCGLAGFDDDAIAPLFAGAPANCVLPYTWQRRRDATLPARVIVAGSRDFTDYRKLRTTLDLLLGRLPAIEIVSGGDRGADALGEHYAVERNLRLWRHPVEWDVYGKAASALRNEHMAWASSHLVVFGVDAAPGAHNLLKVAGEARLAVRNVCVVTHHQVYARALPGAACPVTRSLFL